MKFRKITASSLIFIIAISSMGLYSIGFSQDQVAFKDTQSKSSTQLIADTQDPSHDFREGFKTGHSSKVQSVSYSFLYEASRYVFETICYAQYESYLQRLLFERPSSKLFLDLRSLLI